MKWLLALVLPALAASCAPKPFSGVPEPPKAKIIDVKPAREAVVRASEETTKSREKTAKAEVQLERAAESTKDAAVIAQEAFEKGIAAGSAAADRLRSSIIKISAELSNARQTITELSESLQKSSENLETAKGSIADVQAAAAVKQNEVETLRANLDAANERITAAEKARATLATEAANQAARKRQWRGAALIGWGIILLCLLWKLYRPRIPGIG